MTVTGNPKGELLERLQARGQAASFEVSQRGADHAPSFLARVRVEGHTLGQAEGSTRREAERVASLAALALLDSNLATRPAGAQPGQPVPIYSEVLREALLTAHERLPQSTPLDEVGREAARVYRALLTELGLTEWGLTERGQPDQAGQP